ncbi:hypothetical protein DFH06DRAFT_1180014 [Mycena polygramma]|nr:hypothetical protein DFH06DRAFT_1180014 [Mycena polygramma]
MNSPVDAPGWSIRDGRRVLVSDSLSSQFEQLSVAQNPPTEAEVALARTMVLKGKKELKELRAQISELKAQEKALTEYIADHQRIVFSINRFPPEILSLVFLYTLPPGLMTGKPVHTESPWLVSQVCKLWRDVSLSSQVLWASPKIHPVPNQSPSQLILQLARSGNAQLHPTLAGWGPRQNPRLHRLLAPLIAQSERWVSLRLTMDWTLMPAQFMALRGQVSQLEELQIEGVWITGATALPHGSRLGAFAIAPHLRTLSVTNVCEPATSLLMPWHQLTKYRSVGTGHEHLDVLFLCPNLVVADLGFSVPVLPGGPVVMHLPHLVQLTLGDADFLRVLSLPVLRRVVLQKTAPEADALLPLLDLVRRDRPPLHSLALLHSALVTPTLVAVLSETPTIDTLRLHIRRGDTAAVDNLISQLTLLPGEDAPVLAPNLTTLELVGRGAFDQERFVDMVESRWDQEGPSSSPPCKPILEVILRTTPRAPLSSQTVERLRDMKKEGLRVTLAAFSFYEDDLTSHFAN